VAFQDLISKVLGHSSTIVKRSKRDPYSFQRDYFSTRNLSLHSILEYTPQEYHRFLRGIGTGLLFLQDIRKYFVVKVFPLPPGIISQIDALICLIAGIMEFGKIYLSTRDPTGMRYAASDGM
jgi:hypothetical protein